MARQSGRCRGPPAPAHLDVDLWPVERAAARVHRVAPTLALERLNQRVLADLPEHVVADALLGSRRKVDLILGEAIRRQHLLHEVQHAADLVLDLWCDGVVFLSGREGVDPWLLTCPIERLRFCAVSGSGPSKLCVLKTRPRGGAYIWPQDEQRSGHMPHETLHVSLHCTACLTPALGDLPSCFPLHGLFSLPARIAFPNNALTCLTG
eukprot:359137-Chlamydomonas_euryale.AAC.5